MFNVSDTVVFVAHAGRRASASGPLFLDSADDSRTVQTAIPLLALAMFFGFACCAVFRPAECSEVGSDLKRECCPCLIPAPFNLCVVVSAPSFPRHSPFGAVAMRCCRDAARLAFRCLAR